MLLYENFAVQTKVHNYISIKLEVTQFHNIYSMIFEPLYILFSYYLLYMLFASFSKSRMSQSISLYSIVLKSHDKPWRFRWSKEFLCLYFSVSLLHGNRVLKSRSIGSTSYCRGIILNSFTTMSLPGYLKFWRSTALAIISTNEKIYRVHRICEGIILLWEIVVCCW